MGVRCLIVDDSPGFIQAARALLEQEGMTVVGVASTSEAAVQHAVRQCPDVTLVDIDLAGRSGIDLAGRLANECGASAGCLILISAHAEEEFADLIEASPAAGFLPKSALCADAIVELMAELHGMFDTLAPNSKLPPVNSLNERSSSRKMISL